MDQKTQHAQMLPHINRINISFCTNLISNSGLRPTEHVRVFRPHSYFVAFEHVQLNLLLFSYFSQKKQTIESVCILRFFPFLLQCNKMRVFIVAKNAVEKHWYLILLQLKTVNRIVKCRCTSVVLMCNPHTDWHQFWNQTKSKREIHRTNWFYH